MKTFFLFSMAFSAAGIFAAPPAVTWVSTPVRPGETVIVHGGPFETNLQAVALAGDGQRIEVAPLQVAPDSLWFVYPETWRPGTLTARFAGVEARVNVPVVWWVQGNRGPAAAPGGWVQVFGRCIAMAPQTKLEMTMEGKHSVLSPEAGADEFHAVFKLPDTLKTGDYALALNNGYLPAAEVLHRTLRVEREGNFWKAKRFDITGYGAVANDAIDDSRAIRAALVDIEKNGGGVLYVPRGRFGMTGTIELPPHTLLQGAGEELSQIYWLDEDHPQDPFVSGRYAFGIADIFLAAGNFAKGIVTIPPAETDTWTNADILLSHVRARFLHTDLFSAEEGFRRSCASAAFFSLSGDRIRMLDCDFIATKGSASVHGDWSEIRGNRVKSNGPMCTYVGGQQTIFQGNDFRGCGISFANGTRNFYFADCQMGEIFGDGDRETMTFDGGNPCRSGQAVAVSASSVTFPKTAWRHSESFWIGKPIYIIGGTGAGQQRFIREIRNHVEVVLDRPWDMLPDRSSHFVIALTRSQLLFTGNTVYDGNPFAFYGTCVDGIVARNTAYRNCGFHAHGMFKGGVPEPSWFVQFLENTVAEGNAVRGPASYIMPAADGWIAFFDRGIARPLTYPENRIGVIRRNMLNNNARISSSGRVDGLLVEGNRVTDADVGISIASSVNHAVVRGNHFERVLQPFDFGPNVKASPEDTFAAAVAAAGLGPQKDRPSLLKAVSKVYAGKTVSPALFEMLTGLQPAQPSEYAYSRLLKDKVLRVSLSGVYAAGNPPATLTAEVLAKAPGWEIKTEKPVVALRPGRAPTERICWSRETAADWFRFPIALTIAGEGWSLKTVVEHGNLAVELCEMLVAGPFKNTSGKDLDAGVHPPERKLDFAARYETLDGMQPWRAFRENAKGQMDLRSVFTNVEMATAHVVAVLRAAKPMAVKIDYGTSQRQLFFVNGEHVGSSARRDAVRTVYLRAGDNLLHLITSHATGAWPVRLRVTAVDPVLPGELTQVSADEITRLAGFRGSSGAKPLERTDGVAWTEIFADDFNRTRVGDGWRFQGIPWMSQELGIDRGALAADSGWGFFGFAKPVGSRVRIEFDLIAKRGTTMAGVFLAPEGLLWHSFWGQQIGRGYLFSLGWHDARNCRVMRDTETVVLKEKKEAILPEAEKPCHVIAQFIPPMMRLYADGRLALEYRDAAYLPALSQIGLFTLGGARFDNVRIFSDEGK